SADQYTRARRQPPLYPHAALPIFVRRGRHRFRPDANLIIAVPALDPGAELPVSVHVIPQTVADGGEEIAAAFDPLPLLPADLPRNEVLQWRQPLLACFPAPRSEERRVGKERC